MPGRPEKPVAADAPQPVRELALRLRGMRAAAGMTLAELSTNAGYSTPTVQRVLAGRQVPGWQVVEGLAHATHANAQEEAELRQLWDDAAIATHRAKEEESASSEVPSGVFEVFIAFQKGRQRATLEGLYKQAGRPSVRALAEHTRLSRSAVHRAVTGQSTAGADVVARSLLRCVAPGERDDWERQIGEAFGGFAPSPHVPPVQAAPAASPEVDQAITEFVDSLRHFRNLIAHGQVETDPQFAAHVMELAALAEDFPNRRPALGGAELELPGPQADISIPVPALPHAVESVTDEEPAGENLASDPPSGRRGRA